MVVATKTHNSNIDNHISKNRTGLKHFENQKILQT